MVDEELINNIKEAFPGFIRIMRQRCDDLDASLALEDFQALKAFTEDMSVRTLTCFSLLQALAEANQLPLDKPLD